MIWANLLHLGYNMWEEAECKIPPGADAERRRLLNSRRARPYLRFDDKLWDELLRKMAVAGMNMVVLDLADGVKYESHPEIAVRHAWTPKRLRQELKKMRTLGLEPIPKLNFATTHDAWLGPYARCVSTEAYYAVCRDLIAEVMQLFGRPRFLHIGMDEESADHQRFADYAVIRQHDLWWRDFLFLVKQVERGGARAWVWSDYLWNHPEEFWKRMPKSVLQSNWYYGAKFSRRFNTVRAYLELEAHGYDQAPTASNWACDDNFEKTVAYCRKHIAPSRLLGFLQTPWLPTIRAHRRKHLSAIEQAGRVISARAQ
jgi:hypothetical protein